MNETKQSGGQYATIGDLKMYYEVHGSGTPLVLVHGGGSTIQSTFGRVLPMLAENHQVIAVELQAHGHTLDIDRPLSFEQDADDIAALLGQLDIQKAAIMGFSNGGTTAIQMAIRHPASVSKLVLLAATYKRDGMQAGFFESMQQASLDNMLALLKDAYFQANPDQKGFEAMFHRDVARMQTFADISDDDIRSIQAPALVINGDAEVIRAEHALELSRTLPNARLAILPSGHGDYIGEICAADQESKMPELVIAMIEEFLRA